MHNNFLSCPTLAEVVGIWKKEMGGGCIKKYTVLAQSHMGGSFRITSGKLTI